MRQLLLVLLLSFSALQSSAQAFDLAGPKVDIHVKRGSVTLPIGEVSNLLPGDGYGFIRTFRIANRRAMF